MYQEAGGINMEASNRCKKAGGRSMEEGCKYYYAGGIIMEAGYRCKDVVCTQHDDDVTPPLSPHVVDPLAGLVEAVGVGDIVDHHRHRAVTDVAGRRKYSYLLWRNPINIFREIQQPHLEKSNNHRGEI